VKTPRLSLVLALTVFAIAAAAQQPTTPQPQPPQPDDPLARVLFPPELVMQHQQDIALRPEQRAVITKAIQDFQTKVVDLQWRMQDQSQRLATLLEKPTVDPVAALAQVDEVLGVEREVKRAHMTLLIQIKNTLSAEQQARLSAARLAAAHVGVRVY
jgi:Spy/CpxP family protein refolding chaperone